MTHSIIVFRQGCENAFSIVAARQGSKGTHGNASSQPFWQTLIAMPKPNSSLSHCQFEAQRGRELRREPRRHDGLARSRVSVQPQSGRKDCPPIKLPAAVARRWRVHWRPNGHLRRPKKVILLNYVGARAQPRHYILFSLTLTIVLLGKCEMKYDPVFHDRLFRESIAIEN